MAQDPISLYSGRLHRLLLLLSSAMLSHFAFFFASYAAPPAAASRPPLPLSALCNTTSNASLCLSTLSSYPSSQPSALLQDLTAYIVSVALVEVNRTYWIGETDEEATSEKFTLQDCLELLDDSLDGLNRSVDRLTHLDPGALPDSLRSQVMDVRVWLSASLTYLDTCWDELADPKVATLKARFRKTSQDVEPLLAIALCFAQALQQQGGASTSYALPRHPPPHL